MIRATQHVVSCLMLSSLCLIATPLAAQTHLVLDTNPGIAGGSTNSIATLGDLAIFASIDPTGTRLYASDGSTAGTSVITVLDSTPVFTMPTEFTTVGSRVLFAWGDGTGVELWATDGTAAGTGLVKDIRPGPFGSNPLGFGVIDGVLYFSAAEAGANYELWRSDGTAAGTWLCKDIHTTLATGSNPAGYAKLGSTGSFLFAATDATSGRELWKSDGTAAGTSLVKDIVPGPGGVASSNPSGMIAFGDLVFFRALNEIWTSDGTTAGTIALTSSLVYPGQFAVQDGRLFFQGNYTAHGSELWVSDGTLAGTHFLHDLLVGGSPAASSMPHTLTPVGSRWLFFAATTAFGVELWRTDGVTTELFSDIRTGSASSSPTGNSWLANPRFPVTTTGKMFFVANDGVHGAEPFVFDTGVLAATAGMRYAVMTAKHHEGFTLFESNEPYSRANEVTGGTNISPAGRDVAREFAEAMRARNIKPGFYYSLLDWQHPDAYPMALPGYAKSDRPRDHARYIAYVRAHVEELLTGYGDLATIWFDYSDKQRQGEAWGASALLDLMRQKQPRILVNNRLYEGLENKHGDFGTPEKYVPPTGLPGMDWEVNHTLNESYGYSAHDSNWKDTTTVVRLLCDIVSKGGNLLLNIGPDAEGRMPEPAQRALRGVGAWLQVHSDAIFGTTASPFTKLPWGRATRKGDTLYLMVFDWPENGTLHVPARASCGVAKLLGSEAAITVTASARGLVIALPPRPIDAACSVVAVPLRSPLEVLPFTVAPGADGAFTLLPHDATLAGPQLRIEQVGAVGDVKYNLGYWLDPSAFAAWPVLAEQAARYRVTAELACKDAAAGATCTLACGDAVLTFRVAGTGGWQDYRTVDLGTLALPAGRSEIVLRANDKPGEAVLNLRTLRLTPQ